MSTPATDPRRFYTETIPDQFNRALDAQAGSTAPERAMYEEMCAVDATIRVDVEGEGGGRFYLNIEKGRMRAADTAAHEPFLTLLQDRRAFERIAQEASESAMALLGGLSGLAGEMRLTRRRIADLRQVDGLVQLEVTGPEGFVLRSHFGGRPLPEQPDAIIQMDASAYAKLRGGTLDPETAFIEQQIVVQGNMQTAMQLALAAVAPD